MMAFEQRILDFERSSITAALDNYSTMACLHQPLFDVQEPERAGGGEREKREKKRKG
jgi:hypothetical protein